MEISQSSRVLLASYRRYTLSYVISVSIVISLILIIWLWVAYQNEVESRHRLVQGKSEQLANRLGQLTNQISIIRSIAEKHISSTVPVAPSPDMKYIM